MQEVLLVGVSPPLLRQLEMGLGLRGFRVQACTDAISATQILSQSSFPMVIIQYDMAPISGLEFILWLRQNRSVVSLLVCGRAIPKHLLDFLEALNILVYDQTRQPRTQLLRLLEQGLTPFFSKFLAS